MEAVAAHNPSDNEAAAFHALALFGILRVRDHSYATQTKAAAILKPVLQKYPNHPGAPHYLIHAYDAPDRAQQVWTTLEDTKRSRIRIHTRFTVREVRR